MTTPNEARDSGRVRILKSARCSRRTGETIESLNTLPSYVAGALAGDPCSAFNFWTLHKNELVAAGAGRQS